MHTARVGFPILVEYALQRSDIEYGEWDAEIVRRGLGHRVMAVLYGRPAGVIANACIAYSKATGLYVPPINLLVVEKHSRLPGSGADYYIEKFCKEDLEGHPVPVSNSGRRAIIDQAQEAIFDFQGWPAVLEAFGLTMPRKPAVKAVSEKKPRLPNPAGWLSGPEGKAHKALKERVAETPALVGLLSEKAGHQEHKLWSGDRLDVYFTDLAMGVEVKAEGAGYDELHRGIFQCVKYKAVLRAQQLHQRVIPAADCILAIGGEMPDELRVLAEFFKIRLFERLAE